MKFRVFINHGIDGPYDITELKKLPHFSPSLLVCPDGEYDWQPASAYPALVPPAGPVVTQTEEPEKSKHWRQAVIGGDIPEMRYQAYKPPTDSAKSASTSKPATPAAKPETPARKLFRSFTSGLHRQRKGLLTGLLWTIALGIYCPQADSLLAIYQGLEYPVEILPHAQAWSHRLTHGGKHWKPVHVSRKPAALKAVPSDSEAEIASDELGDGRILKTYVVIRYRDGIRTEETRTAVVEKHVKRKHRKVSLLHEPSSDGVL